MHVQWLCLCVLWLLCLQTNAIKYLDHGNYQVELYDPEPVELVISYSGTKTDGQPLFRDEKSPDLEVVQRITVLMDDIYDEIQYRLRLKRSMAMYLSNHYLLGRLFHLSTLKTKLMQAMEGPVALYEKANGPRLQVLWTESQERLANLVVLYADLHEIRLAPSGPKNIQIIHWRFTVTVPVMKYSLDQPLPPKYTNIASDDLILYRNIQLPSK